MSEEKTIELKDEEIKQVVGGTTTVVAEFIDERKERAARTLEDKVPVFKAGNSNKESVK